MSHPTRSFALARPPVQFRSARAALVAKWFGISKSSKPKMTIRARSTSDPSPDLLLPAPGEILLVTGPSGAGKSSTLAAMRRLANDQQRWIDLNEISLPNQPIVDCLESPIDPSTPVCEVTLQRILGNLGRVGLAEVWSYLRTPSELSEGQRWRLKLAIAIEQAGDAASETKALPILVADEFAALLDRVTACVIARTLRRAIDDTSSRRCAVVATSHDDLNDALRPDRVIVCDFETARVEERS